MSFVYAFKQGFHRSGLIVLIKSEILIITGMVWPVSSETSSLIRERRTDKDVLFISILSKVKSIPDCTRPVGSLKGPNSSSCINLRNFM